MNQIGIPESERPELLAYLKKTYRYEDGAIFNRRTGRRVQGDRMNNGYSKMTITYKGGSYSTPFQRVVWTLCKDQLPTLTIDHINGNKRDNRIENLREVSQPDNQTHYCRGGLTRSLVWQGLKNMDVNIEVGYKDINIPSAIPMRHSTGR